MDNRKSLQKRFIELQSQSIRDNCYYFTDFLSPVDIDTAYSVCDSNMIDSWGGSEAAERQMIRFGNPGQIGYDMAYPMICMEINPLNLRFTENLNHRDYLGALMNLGIERHILGDIYCTDTGAYAFIAERMAGFVRENLFRVRHTDVSCTLSDMLPEEALPRLEPMSIVAPSPRLDALLAKIFHISRSEAKRSFERQEVFLNGRVCANPCAEPEENDTISLRHHGKCIYRGIERTTRKGHFSILIDIYR